MDIAPTPFADKRRFAEWHCRIVNRQICPLTRRERAGIPTAMAMNRLAIEIFLVLVTGLALGLIGPFGTFEMETAPRLAYWIVFGTVGYAIFRPLIIVAQWLSDLTNIPLVISVGLALLIAAMPMTLLVAGLMWKFDLSTILRWEGLGTLYFQVWLIGFLTNGLFRLIFQHGNAVPMPEPARVSGTGSEPPALPLAMPVDAEPATPRFADRLPSGFGPLLALRGEDHYVRAYAPERETMVLIRLRDAVAELGDAGTQVHRSWWVARDAVTHVKGNGREMMLVLQDGTEAPVSRDHAARLKAMGWIDQQGRWSLR